MPLWKNHHFIFQRLTFNSKDPVNSEENILKLIQIHMTYPWKPESSQTHRRERMLPCLFPCFLWPWPSNHYSYCVMLECKNKYKLLLSLPHNSVNLHCRTTKSCRETTKFHISGIKSSNDNRYSSPLCRDCRERTLLCFLRQYEILSFQTKFQRKACKETYTKASKELSARFQHYSKL